MYRARIILSGLLLTLSLGGFLFAPVTVDAAGLVPCSNRPDATTGVIAEADRCTFAQFLVLIKNVIVFALDLVLPIAALLFAYVGFLYLTAAGEEKQIAKAKKVIPKLLIGVAVALLAWVIVVTIMKTLGVDPSQGYSILDYDF